MQFIINRMNGGSYKQATGYKNITRNERYLKNKYKRFNLIEYNNLK